MKTKTLFLLFTIMFVPAHCANGSEDPIPQVDSGLEVTAYAPSGDPVQFRTCTHLAFGPGEQEIVTDLKNNRFVYRNSPGEPFQVSPVPLKGQHSVAYNPADSLYYANDTDNHRLIAFADPMANSLPPVKVSARAYPSTGTLITLSFLPKAVKRKTCPELGLIA